MNKQRLISVLAIAAAGSVSAQDLQLSFTGRVIDVIDENQIFQDFVPGQLSAGDFTVDFGAADLIPDLPDDTGFPFNFGIFDIPSFGAEIGGVFFDGENPVAAIIDDQPNPDGSVIDSFQTVASATFDDGRIINLRSRFVGNGDLFTDTGLDGVQALDLSNLIAAEVTIEFSTFPDFDPTDPDFDPSDLDGFEVLTSQVRVEILSLDSDGQRVVTLGFLSDVNQNDEVDVGDFNAWLGAYNDGSYLADQNLDGRLNGADFNSWLSNFIDEGGQINGG